MSIRIERVSVKNLGPLQSFDQRLKQVNLFYGHNETGKTYLVEFIYRALFKHLSLRLRGSTANGLVTISGLEKHETVFSPSGRMKLEDFWEVDKPGLPSDFSKLLVVKGADLDLGEGEQGIDEVILKEFLSDEGLLDTIEKEISSTVRTSILEDGIISGSNRGEIKTQRETRELLNRYDEQITKVEAQISGGKRAELASRIIELKEKLEGQEHARQHLAFKLDTELAALDDELAGLPEDLISKLDKTVHDHTEKTAELERKSIALEESRKKGSHFSWLKKATAEYEKLVYMEKSRQQNSGLVWLILAVLSALASIVFILLQQPYLGIGAILLGVVFSAIYLVMLNRIPTADLQREELIKIEEEFRRRFDVKGKIDGAALSAKREELEKYHSRAEILSGDAEELKVNLEKLVLDINHILGKFSKGKVKKGDWQAAVNQLQAERKELVSERQLKEVELSALGVPRESFREKSPAVPYDRQLFQTIENDIQKVTEEKEDLEENLENLKQAVCGLTGEKLGMPWEDLIESLRRQRAETADRYREVTAGIIAGIKVNEVLEELRQVEAERIDEGLRSKEVSQALLGTTGHYNLVEREEDSLIMTDTFGRYPLSGLSTGAREQVLLGLRMGFAARLLNGEPLFLILDDAFQHSDWVRRENLVNKLFSLAGEGWQILYFSMDDHIKELFEKAAGKKMGNDGYQTISVEGN